MSKGKKFDAAEKHFLKKEDAYRKEQKCLYEALTVANATIAQLREENAALAAKLAAVALERDEALKQVAMNPEELQKHIEQTKKAAEMCGILTAVSKFT